MKSRNSRIENIDFIVTSWMAENEIFILGFSVGIIFVWCGVLKFFSEVSFKSVSFAPTLEGHTKLKNWDSLLPQ